MMGNPYGSLGHARSVVNLFDVLHVSEQLLRDLLHVERGHLAAEDGSRKLSTIVAAMNRRPLNSPGRYSVAKACSASMIVRAASINF